MSKKYEWGNATWYLFHIIAEKLTNDIYIVEKSNIINLITTICNNLPCPSCSEHASKYLLTINFNNINSNEDLKMFFFKFHNLVNIRIHKPQFSLDELNSKYKNTNLRNIILYFMKMYFKKYNNEKLMMHNFYRNKSKNIINNYLIYLESKINK